MSAKVISFKKYNGVMSLWKLQSSKKITVVVHEHFFLQEESFR